MKLLLNRILVTMQKYFVYRVVSRGKSGCLDEYGDDEEDGDEVEEEEVAE
jgi:hypothetical protein